MTIAWGGMTPGNIYLLQFWVQDGRLDHGGRIETITGGVNTSATLAFDSGTDGTGPGQYIIGTFIADGTGTQLITINPLANPRGPSAQINLLQLRDITPVPEPSTLAFLAFGAGAMFYGFRRKSSAI
ncbi:MAG: PEP-CTERM sorting domain-containing protein [Limisphaerales bacterium]